MEVDLCSSSRFHHKYFHLCDPCGGRGDLFLCMMSYGSGRCSFCCVLEQDTSL